MSLLGKRQTKALEDILAEEIRGMDEYRNKSRNLEKIVNSSKQKNTLKEDYAKGIPDFALSQVASETAAGLRRCLNLYITQSSHDPSDQRRKMSAAAAVLDELEAEIKEKLEDKLLQFLRSC